VIPATSGGSIVGNEIITLLYHGEIGASYIALMVEGKECSLSNEIILVDRYCQHDHMPVVLVLRTILPVIPIIVLEEEEDDDDDSNKDK
jgi:hypothetical protein